MALVKLSSLQTDGGFLLAVFGVALALRQPALQLLWHAFVAVFAHGSQVDFHKLISKLPPRHQEQRGREERAGGRGWQMSEAHRKRRF